MKDIKKIFKKNLEYFGIALFVTFLFVMYSSVVDIKKPLNLYLFILGVGLIIYYSWFKIKKLERRA